MRWYSRRIEEKIVSYQYQTSKFLKFSRTVERVFESMLQFIRFSFEQIIRDVGEISHFKVLYLQEFTAADGLLVFDKTSTNAKMTKRHFLIRAFSVDSSKPVHAVETSS
jgi:hypothetical protein